MPQGTVEKLDRDTGRGYIRPEGGGDTIPFDMTSMDKEPRREAVREGDRVSYEVTGGLAGTMATDVVCL
jgi:cold shock CspA family protein